MIFASLLLFGAGCLNPVRDDGSGATSPIGRNLFPIDTKMQQTTTDLLGVITRYDLENNSLVILFPEGSEDVVRLPDNFVATGEQIGMLARVSGTRDRASRLIKATSVAIVKEPSLHIISPQSQSIVTSPLIVLGFTKASNDRLYWRLRDAKGQMLVEGFADIAGGDGAGFVPYRFEVFLPSMDEQAFSVEVFQKNSNGKEQANVLLPLTALTTRRSLFDVYFAKETKQKNKESCVNVFPVAHSVAATAAITRAAVSELFVGPTQEELNNGLSTHVPDGAQLLSFDTQGRHAIVEVKFSKTPTSCERQGMRAQLEKTLRQFAEIDDVELIER